MFWHSELEHKQKMSFILSFMVYHLLLTLMMTIYYYYTMASIKLSAKTVPLLPQWPLIGSMYYMYRCTSDKYFNMLANRFKKLGRTFILMVGPIPVVATFDSDLCRSILSSKIHVEKPYFAYGLLEKFLGNGLATSHGKFHIWNYIYFFFEIVVSWYSVQDCLLFIHIDISRHFASTTEAPQGN